MPQPRSTRWKPHFASFQHNRNHNLLHFISFSRVELFLLFGFILLFMLYCNFLMAAMHWAPLTPLRPPVDELELHQSRSKYKLWKWWFFTTVRRGRPRGRQGDLVARRPRNRKDADQALCVASLLFFFCFFFGGNAVENCADRFAEWKCGSCCRHEEESALMKNKRSSNFPVRTYIYINI